jgi:hypothetical protein
MGVPTAYRDKKITKSLSKDLEGHCYSLHALTTTAEQTRFHGMLTIHAHLPLQYMEPKCIQEYTHSYNGNTQEQPEQGKDEHGKESIIHNI